jgi:GNAT superfamily N-acetyltransferase
LTDSLSKLVVRHLTSGHRRDGFDCGQPKLNTYVEQYAWQHERRRISRTFVLLAEPDLKVLAFYSLAASGVAFEQMPASEKLPRYPVPVIKLAQLGVDKSILGRGWGKFLLLDALGRAERISREVAAYAVEVDAIDDSARKFYEHFGFTSLLDDAHHLYCTMKKIALLELNPPEV